MKWLEILSGTDVGAHLGRAGHEIAGLVVLREETHIESSGGILILGTENRGEELLLESEPAHLRIHPLVAVAAAADLHGLLVTFLIDVQLGVLGLVLVALLHPGNDHGIVDIYRRDIAGDASHSYEGQVVVHHIGSLVQGVALLDVAAVREREAECHGGVGLRGDLEVEVAGADELSRVDTDRVLAAAIIENVKGRAVVVEVVLHHHAGRLGATARKLQDDLVVLEGHEGRFAGMCGVERGILVDGFLPFAGSVGRSLAGCDKGILTGIDGDCGNYGIPRCNTLGEGY